MAQRSPTTPHQGRVFLERTVRPFVEVYGIQPETPVKPKRLLPGHDTEAYSEWGTTSNFTSQSDNEELVDTKGGGGGTSGFEVIPSDDEDKKDKTLTESSRAVEEIRIENPDDSDQYVIVERITFMDFSYSTGGNWRLKFANN